MHSGVLDIPFTKMSGAGNDFVVVDNRSLLIEDGPSFARIACDRRSGIGADGLLLLEKSHSAAFTMQYFNADGSYGGMCGNGGRCLSRFAYLKKIVATQSFEFEALGRHYTSNIVDNDVKLQLQNPIDLRLYCELSLGQKKISYHFLNTGAPHCVIFVDDNMNLFHSSFENEDIYNLGKEIRLHPDFSPHGTNVDFIKSNSLSSIKIRTYERGVEQETLACGTGAIASALISRLVKKTLLPLAVLVRSGEELKVEADEISGETFKNVSLFGSARMVYNGIIRYNPRHQSIVEANYGLEKEESGR